MNTGATTIKHLTAGMNGVVDELQLSCETIRWLESSVLMSEATGKFAIPYEPIYRRHMQNYSPYLNILNRRENLLSSASAMKYLQELANYSRSRSQCIKPPYYCRTFTMWNANPYYRKGPRQKVKSRVNTISITNMNSRKGELITASFNVEKSEWRVLVYVFGKYQCEGMSVYLQHNRFLDPNIVYQETEFKCTIINVQDPLLQHSREFRHQYTAERSVCGFDIFLPLKDLYNGKYLSGEKKDTIVLQTEIWCYGKEIELPPSPPMSNGLSYTAPWQTQQRINLRLSKPELEPPRDLTGVHKLGKLDIPRLEPCSSTGGIHSSSKPGKFKIEKDAEKILETENEEKLSAPLEANEEFSRSSAANDLVNELVTNSKEEILDQPTAGAPNINFSGDEPKPKLYADRTKENQTSSSNLGPIQPLGINHLSPSQTLICRSAQKEILEPKSCFSTLELAAHSPTTSFQNNRVYGSQSLDIAGKGLTPSYWHERLGAMRNSIFTERGRSDMLSKPGMTYYRYLSGRNEDRAMRMHQQGLQLRPSLSSADHAKQLQRWEMWKRGSEQMATNNFFRTNVLRPPNSQMMYTGNPYLNPDALRLQKQMALRYCHSDNMLADFLR